MQRILPWLALFCATAIAVVAVIELYERRDDDRLALEPTALPSPSVEPVDETPEPEPEETEAEATDEPGEPETEAPEETAEPTAEPTTAREETPAPTQEPEPTATPEPPSTPTPEPLGTAGPIDAAKGRTPRTGGGALPAGVIVTVFALAARVLIERGAKSY